MRLSKVLVGALIVSAGLRIVALAADETTTGYLFAPYGMIPDLSADQKTQIEAIHKVELADEKKLKDKEHDDIVALLNDGQKKELADAMAKDSIEKRATDAEKRAAAETDRAKALRDRAAGMGASTQP